VTARPLRPTWDARTRCECGCSARERADGRHAHCPRNTRLPHFVELADEQPGEEGDLGQLSKTLAGVLGGESGGGGG
jgi:hypothetical protein